jgi:hypothetical protein
MILKVEIWSRNSACGRFGRNGADLSGSRPRQAETYDAGRLLDRPTLLAKNEGVEIIERDIYRAITARLLRLAVVAPHR